MLEDATKISVNDLYLWSGGFCKDGPHNSSFFEVLQCSFAQMSRGSIPCEQCLLVVFCRSSCKVPEKEVTFCDVRFTNCMNLTAIDELLVASSLT